MKTADGKRIECRSCIFYQSQSKSGNRGVCKLNPPTPILMGIAPHPLNPKKVEANFQQILPTMEGQDWCGQWHEAPGEQPEPEQKPEPAKQENGKPALILPE